MSFDNRVGTHQFFAPTPGWGYVPQVNECFAKQHYPPGFVSWETIRTGGMDHIPSWKCIPVSECTLVASQD